MLLTLRLKINIDSLLGHITLPMTYTHVTQATEMAEHLNLM